MSGLTLIGKVLSLSVPLGLASGMFARAVQLGRRQKRDFVPGIVGLTGTAETEIGREGAIRLRGLLWTASSQTRIPADRRVKVIGYHGVTLDVIELHGP